jgi:hypothetical protein
MNDDLVNRVLSAKVLVGSDERADQVLLLQILNEAAMALGAKLATLPVVVDPDVPLGEIWFKHPDGRVDKVKANYP